MSMNSGIHFTTVAPRVAPAGVSEQVGAGQLAESEMPVEAIPGLRNMLLL